MKVTRLISSTAVLAVLFVLVAHTTAAAQQAHGAAGVTVPARSSGVSSPSTLPGPRLQPEWRSVQPAFADSHQALHGVTMAGQSRSASRDAHADQQRSRAAAASRRCSQGISQSTRSSHPRRR